MKTHIKTLAFGSAVAIGLAFGTIACSQTSGSPVSPSAAPVATFDASAAKTTQNFCVFLRSHLVDPPWVVGQEIKVSLQSDGSQPTIMTTTPPHGDACVAVPVTADTVWLYIAATGYCTVDWVPYLVKDGLKGGPTYIWLLPADGNHGCPAQ